MSIQVTNILLVYNCHITCSPVLSVEQLHEWHNSCSHAKQIMFSSYNRQYSKQLRQLLAKNKTKLWGLVCDVVAIIMLAMSLRYVCDVSAICL